MPRIRGCAPRRSAPCHGRDRNHAQRSLCRICHACI